MSRRRFIVFLCLGLAAAGSTWFLVHTMAMGLTRTHAWSMAGIAGVFTGGLAWIRFPAPTDDRSRSRAVLSKTSKSISLWILLALTLAAGADAARQATRGYPVLKPNALIANAEVVDSDFYSASGVPLVNSMYEMKGSEGHHVLVPLDRYEGRLLAMLDERPKGTEIRITGKLRTDVRTVQRSQSGQTGLLTALITPFFVNSYPLA